MWVCNVQLFLLSQPVGTAGGLATDGAVVASKGFLFGFDACFWWLLCLSAQGDLLMETAAKRADVTKGSAASPAIVLSCASSRPVSTSASP